MKRWPTLPVAPRTAAQVVNQYTVVEKKRERGGLRRTTLSLGEVAIVRGEVFSIHGGRRGH